MKKSTDHNKIVIPRIEEEVVVEKRTVATGEVNVSKHVKEHVERVAIDLTADQVEIDRIAFNTYIEKAPEVRYEGDKTIIPVVKEVLVVEKKLMLVEEIHLYRNQQTKTHREDVSLREEYIEVTRTD